MGSERRPQTLYKQSKQLFTNEVIFFQNTYEILSYILFSCFHATTRLSSFFAQVGCIADQRITIWLLIGINERVHNAFIGFALFCTWQTCDGPNFLYLYRFSIQLPKRCSRIYFSNYLATQGNKLSHWLKQGYIYYDNLNIMVYIFFIMAD